MNSLQPARMKIGVISAGKVGAVLGAALRAVHHEIIGVHAISENSKERAESLLPGVPLLQIPDIVEKAEVIMLAVPDDELASLVTGIANATGWKQGQIVFHTSGMHGVSILEPATKQGAIGLAIHPAMSFTGYSLDLARLTETSFGVTGPAPFLPIAQALAVEMGGEPVIIAEDDRALYHAALAHASNHLVTITGQAQQILRQVGIEDPSRYLAPLVRASLDNALSSGESALTGPVARGDAHTVETHRDVLTGFAQEDDAADVRDAYLALARATAERAHARRILTDEQFTQIIKTLS